MFARMGIRIGSSLVGIFVGIVLSAAILGGFSAGAAAVVEATIVFWIVHLVLMFLGLRIFFRAPGISMAILVALAATIVSLVIVDLVVSDITVHGIGAWLAAGVIIWISTAIADVVGTKMIRDRRRG